MEQTTTILHAKRRDAACELRVADLNFQRACKEQSLNFRSGRSIGSWVVAVARIHASPGLNPHCQASAAGRAGQGARASHLHTVS